MASKHQGNLNKGNQKGGDQKMNVDQGKGGVGKSGTNSQKRLGGNPNPGPASTASNGQSKNDMSAKEVQHGT